MRKMLWHFKFYIYIYITSLLCTLHCDEYICCKKNYVTLVIIQGGTAIPSYNSRSNDMYVPYFIKLVLFYFKPDIKQN